MQLPKPGEAIEYELPPAGTFIATCYKFIDLGTQKTVFNNTEKLMRKVMISWELADEPMADGRPFTVNKRYNCCVS